jgi:hypothetical protein
MIENNKVAVNYLFFLLHYEAPLYLHRLQYRLDLTIHCINATGIDTALTSNHVLCRLEASWAFYLHCSSVSNGLYPYLSLKRSFDNSSTLFRLFYRLLHHTHTRPGIIQSR